jgi:hypothetical protein
MTPVRNNNSLEIILLAVVTESPGTIICDGIYIIPNTPDMTSRRYSKPAILAVFFSELEFISIQYAP